MVLSIWSAAVMFNHMLSTNIFVNSEDPGMLLLSLMYIHCPSSCKRRHVCQKKKKKRKELTSAFLHADSELSVSPDPFLGVEEVVSDFRRSSQELTVQRIEG